MSIAASASCSSNAHSNQNALVISVSFMEKDMPNMHTLVTKFSSLSRLQNDKALLKGILRFSSIFQAIGRKLLKGQFNRHGTGEG